MKFRVKSNEVLQRAEFNKENVCTTQTELILYVHEYSRLWFQFVVCLDKIYVGKKTVHQDLTGNAAIKQK